MPVIGEDQIHLAVFQIIQDCHHIAFHHFHGNTRKIFGDRLQDGRQKRGGCGGIAGNSHQTGVISALRLQFRLELPGLVQIGADQLQSLAARRCWGDSFGWGAHEERIIQGRFQSINRRCDRGLGYRNLNGGLGDGSKPPCRLDIAQLLECEIQRIIPPKKSSLWVVKSIFPNKKTPLPFL